MRDVIDCPYSGCNGKVSWTNDRCPVCSRDVGFPNVRAARDPDEVDALEQRYRAAVDSARAAGAETVVAAFEEAVRLHSRAVVTVGASFLADFLESDRGLLSNYHQQVRSEMRRPADFINDTRRRMADASLFGAYGEHIRFAALSLDGEGVLSYGECAVTINDRKTEMVASVLEENSFAFGVRHDISIAHPEPPVGYRADWENRHKLAVTKLAARLHPSTPGDQFAHLLLDNKGDRWKDEFIEVHLYGPLDRQIVMAVSVPRPERKCSALQKALVGVVRDRAQSNGLGWTER